MIHEDDAQAIELALEPPPLGLLPRSASEPAPKTALVERKLRGIDHSPKSSGLLIGQYRLIGELARAPTVLFVEARDAENRPVILQIARLRAVTSPIEKVERHYFEQRIAQATALEAEDRDLGLLAHGAADRPDGSRILFWALPWREEARTLARPNRRVNNPRELCEVGIALAQRLAKRHSYGRMDPLLSEHSVLLLESGGAYVIGAPIFLSSEWLDPDSIPVRLAPEEAMSLIPRPTGDLWRLGTTLESLALGLTEIPEPLKLCLQSFLVTDPAQRVLRATEAIVELEAVRADLSPHDGVDPIAIAETAKLGALGPEAVTSLMLDATADSTNCEATFIPPEIDVAKTQVERAQAIIPDEPEDPTELPDRDDATAIEPPADLQVTELGAPALKRRDEAPTRLFVHDRTPPVKVEDESTSETVQDVPMARMIAEEKKYTTAEIKAWSAMSPALLRELSSPPPRMPSRRYPEPKPVFLAESTTKADELEPELRAALPSPAVKQVVIAGLAALAIFGAAVFAIRSWPEDMPRAHLTAADEVRLDVTPEGAMVIAELDGRVLGKAPMTFIVAPNVERAVLVYREGHEAQRIMLPERGRVHIELRALEKREACAVELDAPRSVTLEGVGTQIGGPDHYEIRGSVVVRAKSGERAQGAWLVRCPAEGQPSAIELKERAKVGQRTIELLAPQGVPVYADGVMAGREAKVGGAFAELRMEIGGRSIERWLATDSDASVVMSDH